MERPDRDIHTLNAGQGRWTRMAEWGRVILLWGLILAWAATGIQSGRAQSGLMGKVKDWTILDFYEAAGSEEEGTNQIKSLLRGASAQPRSDNTVLVDQMWLASFNRDGLTNLIARSPDAVVDMKERRVGSPGPLEIETGTGQLSIRGQGFECRLTNIVLVISNQVETVIHRELVRESGTAVSRLGSAPGLGSGGDRPAWLRPMLRFASILTGSSLTRAPIWWSTQIECGCWIRSGN